MALNEADEEEEAAPKEDSEDGFESDASSEFGIMQSGPRKEKDTKEKPNGKKNGKDAKPKPAAEPSGKTPKLAQMASKTLDSLTMITPLAIWQGSAKMKDIQSHVTRALELQAKLEAEGSSQSKVLANDLQEAATRMSKFSEAILSITMDGDLRGSVQSYSYTEVFCSLPADCVNAILADLGRKLVEARKKSRVESSLEIPEFQKVPRCRPWMVLRTRWDSSSSTRVWLTSARAA